MDQAALAQGRRYPKLAGMTRSMPGSAGETKRRPGNDLPSSQCSRKVGAFGAAEPANDDRRHHPNISDWRSAEACARRNCRPMRFPYCKTRKAGFGRSPPRMTPRQRWRGNRPTIGRCADVMSAARAQSLVKTHHHACGDHDQRKHIRLAGRFSAKKSSSKSASAPAMPPARPSSTPDQTA